MSMMVIEYDAQVFYSFFSLMEDSDDDEYNQVTLLDIKENLKNYFTNKLKSLAIVLIDIVNELTKDKEGLKKDLKKCEKEMIELSVLVTELQAVSKSFYHENDLLNKILVRCLSLTPKGRVKEATFNLIQKKSWKKSRMI